MTLFNVGDYVATRKVGWEAVLRGLVTPELAARTLLSLLPPPLIRRLRQTARLWFSASRG